ncbi:MAG: phosphodiester glycosidase family protein [Bacilli bacterium]
MKKKKKFIIIVTVILDILAIIFLFFSYGPIAYFRNLLVTSAMSTQSHKYLARTLYNETTIEEVLSLNFVVEIEENTNTSEIAFEEIVETEKYESIYEEQILKKNEGNDLYKIIPISGSGYVGYVTVIYDASKIELVTSRYLGTKGEMLQNMSKNYGAAIAINAGGFNDPGGIGNGGTPTGTVIQNGKVIYQGGATGWTGGLIGFNSDNVLVLTKDSPSVAIANGIEDAIEFGPFLIVNGQRAIISGNGGYGIAPRTAIAQRKDGIVLFITIDGRQPGYSLGVDMGTLTDILERYKAYNAANLDGGASSSLNEYGELISKPCALGVTGERWLPNAWMVK